MAMILEVLDSRSGAVRARLRLDGTPVRLGRGLDNDVILDDPYAEAAHARIAADDAGAIVVQDLGSVNRLLLTASGERVDHVVAAPGTELRIGRTPVRFRDAAEALPPALADTARQRWPWLRWLDTTPGRLSLIAAVFGGVGIWTWLSSYERSGAEEAFAAALGIGMLAAFWAGIWAVAGRIVTHRFRFLGHMAVVCLATAAVLLIGEVTSFGEFLFPDNALWSGLAFVTGFGILAALIAGHLRLASGMATRRRWVTALAAGAIVFALGWVAVALEDDSFSDVPEFSGVLKPGRRVPTITPVEFRAVAADLRLEVDALRAEMDARAGR